MQICANLSWSPDSTPLSHMRHPVAITYHAVNVGLTLLTLVGPFGGLRVETFILAVPSMIAVWYFLRPLPLLRLLVGLWCVLAVLAGFNLMLGWSRFNLGQIGIGAWLIAGTIITSMALFDNAPRKSGEEGSPPEHPNF